jgi:Z1 domain/SWI2/SNF2 ATPase
MAAGIDIATLKAKAKLTDRYQKQLNRLKVEGIQTDCVEQAVNGTTAKLDTQNATSMVVYGDPQSGKTEMMICLTAKLLDQGYPIIVHLLNDSVDLLSQNLKRFKSAGLAPAALTSSELKKPLPKEFVVLCKKNTKDLESLIDLLKARKDVVVVDDEADYATPNSAVNKGTKTKINEWVGKLKGSKGKYIGVTATPARLDLNNTFENDTKKWVKFPTHNLYTGQDTFFPIDMSTVQFRLKLLTQGGSSKDAEDALIRFLVTVAFLNTTQPEENYTMLVHTSGKKTDHEADRDAIEKMVNILRDPGGSRFDALVSRVYNSALALYPNGNAQAIAEYVVANASRTTLVVLNSGRDRKAAGDTPTDPTSPFTIIIGGNIVSRGVTFPRLLSMFFTRDVRSKLQQDTYIQRARMFGARGSYLEHFELTIPSRLYEDWHRCFIYHRLALASIENNLGVPVWVGDGRIAIASSTSIDKKTVVRDKGEMSFAMFKNKSTYDGLISTGPTDIETLKELQSRVGEAALPTYLINFIKAALKKAPGSLAIHQSSSIVGSKSGVNHGAISRRRGFIGNPQLELTKFPNAIHHIKIFYNGEGNARVFYKVGDGVQFTSNERP